MRYFVLAAVLIVAGCNAAADQPSPAAQAAEPKKVEVTLSLKNIAELEHLIASKRGKIVVLDAWSTYCEPCMKEFPGLVALHKAHGPDKVACISLCANYTGVGKPEDEIAEPLQFVKDQGATFDNVFCTEADTALYKKFNFGSVPTIFVYDREGKLIKTFDGEPKYTDVEKFVAPLLQ